MSVHTMPPMSMICEDFLKSMVKSCDTTTSHEAYNDSSTDNDVLTTRLNGDVNGYGSSQSDEEDDKDDTTELDKKLTNGGSPVSISSRELRKDLMKKTEELKRERNPFALSASNLTNLPAASEVEESILKKLSLQVLSYDF